MKLIHANVGLLLAVMLFGAPVVAQASAEGNDERTYGTASDVIHMVQAFAFTGERPSDNAHLDVTDSRGRYCTSPSVTCQLAAGIFLPAGAVVTSIELDACIFSDGVVAAGLKRFASNELSEGLVAAVSTEGVDVVGCAKFPSSATAPETIDNRNNYYVLRVTIFGDGTTSARFHGVRIKYHLQVSSAPATATFDDVPTNHQFFPFIEALAAAGITGGCSISPPLYCPDNFVTRGQMAVFISRALGLHFAP